MMMLRLEDSTGGGAEGGDSGEGGVAEASGAGASSPTPGEGPLLLSKRSWLWEEMCFVSQTRRRINIKRKRWPTSSRGPKVMSRRGRCIIPRMVNRDTVKRSQRRIIDGSAGSSSQGRREKKRIWMILQSFRVLTTVQSERLITLMILLVKRTQ